LAPGEVLPIDKSQRHSVVECHPTVEIRGSNREHHDFQTGVPNTRTRAESPEIARVVRRDQREDCDEMSRK
jgi:hypothetical protein